MDNLGDFLTTTTIPVWAAALFFLVSGSVFHWCISSFGKTKEENPVEKEIEKLRKVFRKKLRNLKPPFLVREIVRRSSCCFCIKVLDTCNVLDAAGRSYRSIAYIRIFNENGSIRITFFQHEMGKMKTYESTEEDVEEVFRKVSSVLHKYDSSQLLIV